MLAAASGNVDAVKALVDGGADVNAKEPVRGLTPVMFAAASNRADGDRAAGDARRGPQGRDAR